MKHWTEFNTNNINYNTVIHKKGRQTVVDSDDILTFDIETSSGWKDENGNVFGYKPFLNEDFYKEKQAVSLCYIWQFSFNDEVYYGRELQDFYTLLTTLPNTINFTIYVHNLAFEFEFLANLWKWEEQLSRKAHKVMQATPFDFPNVHFRCSYFLTRLSLDAWGKELGVLKKTGDLDYTKLRTPMTKLTDVELGYCEQDCIVVYEGIKTYLKKYKHIYNIPLTQTGEVRRVIKNKMELSGHTQWMKNLVPENADFYKKLKKAYAGGYTHANYNLAGSTIKPVDVGCAFDFASSYPAVMCSEKFPVNQFKPAKFEIKRIDEYAYLMLVHFENVDSKLFNNYISVSKTFNAVNVIKDNGRIISADEFDIWITEQDIDIILKAYDCDYTVLECYRSKKSYLPKVLVEYTLELYNNKTKYKGLPDKKEIYTQSKQFNNSLYGMAVTDIIQDSVEYDDGEWLTKFMCEQDVDDYLQELKYNAKKKPFMAYQFGVWISAYARHNLWECLMFCDEDAIYCDTDSIKVRKFYDFTWYNDKVKQKLQNCCKFHGLDVNLTNPADTKGINHQLGNFDREDNWTEFKTLGAKRYCYRDEEDTQLHLTVSGISKQAVLVLKDNIENFNEDIVFDKDYFEQFRIDCENGLAKTYNKKFDGLTFDEICYKFNIHDGTKKMTKYCEMDTVTWNKGKYDEYTSHARFGINLRNTSYSTKMADDYLELLANNFTHKYLKCIH